MLEMSRALMPTPSSASMLLLVGLKLVLPPRRCFALQGDTRSVGLFPLTPSFAMGAEQGSRRAAPLFIVGAASTICAPLVPGWRWIASPRQASWGPGLVPGHPGGAGPAHSAQLVGRRRLVPLRPPGDSYRYKGVGRLLPATTFRTV